MPIIYTKSWNKNFYDDIIDVRSPKEFQEDNIPYSINLPVLSNKERELIGTIYKKESPFKARKLGASLISKNISKILKTKIYEKKGSWKPLIYCWRGGQRSKALATVLSEIGWKIKILNGGYKTYRGEIIKKIDVLVKKHKYLVVSGQTGCGKSVLLKELGNLELNIIDLEDIASHKGSLLGKLNNRPQPTQKMFESNLYKELAKLDVKKKVFIENESSKIGNIHLPKSILNKIINSEKINIVTPIDSRINFLIKDYKNFINKKNSFEELFEYAEEKKGKSLVKEWRKLHANQKWRELAGQLIEKYYDPLYNHNSSKKKSIVVRNYYIRQLTTKELKKLSLLIKQDFG